jgi:hypothetical protein
MTKWLIHWLLTAKRHIRNIPAILCRMTKWKWLLLGLKEALVRQQSEMGSKIGIRISL